MNFVVDGDLIAERGGCIEEGVHTGVAIGELAGGRGELQGRVIVQELVRWRGWRGIRPADRVRQGDERLDLGRATERMIAPRKRPGAEPPRLQIERIDD